MIERLFYQPDAAGPPPASVFVTADVVLFGTGPDGARRVLLIERRWEPFAGCWALPGGHLDPSDADAEAAARRELAEETGLDLAALAPGTGLRQVGAYSAVGRDPRGRYVTIAYTAVVRGLPGPVAGDDAARARWVLFGELVGGAMPLAFDHARILADAVRVAH